MAHDQIFLHSFLSGECPHRWSVVPGRILAKLVILAALLQVIPVDVISSLTDPAASEQQTSDCVSLDANMHAAPCWATPWVSVCRLADASSRDSEFSHDDVAQSSRIVVAPCGLRSCEKRCSVKSHIDRAKGAGDGTATLNPVLQQAHNLIQKNDYSGAANLLAAAGYDPQVRNILGVCLMRMGRIDEAITVYRSFVLQPGTVYERVNISGAAKRNFATALLMKGLPSGAVSVLDEVHDTDHPMAIRLYSAIKRWEKSLSWFRWLDWKINAIHPTNCRVSLDFEPGELDIDIPVQHPIEPDKPQTGFTKLAA